MSLTPEETRIVNEVGFDPAIVEFVRAHTPKPIQRLEQMTSSRTEPVSGLSVAVADGEEAERLMKAVGARLKENGYRAFWSKRPARDTDEVAILKTIDPNAMILLRGTDGANYGVTTEDILDRLNAWREICEFDVVGADHDWVAIQFSRLPEKICTFAEDVYQFCPDSVEQGVGLMHEHDDPQRFEEARALCPEVSVKSASEDEMLAQLARLAPDMAEEARELYRLAAEHSTPVDMGVRLLALELKKTRYLFLWWD